MYLCGCKAFPGVHLGQVDWIALHAYGEVYHHECLLLTTRTLGLDERTAVIRYDLF